MLFIRVQGVPQENLRIKKNKLESFAPELYEKNAEIVITGKKLLTCYRIVSVSLSETFVDFTLSELNSVEISETLENVIYAGNETANIPKRTEKELEQYLNAQKQGPLILKIWQEDSTVKSILIDESLQVCVERRVSEEEWERFEMAFQNLRQEINIYLKKNALKEAEESVRAHRELLRNLKNKLGFPKISPFRELHVYQSRDMELYPWELDKTPVIVRYFIGPVEKKQRHDGGMVTIYDENLKNAVSEAGKISMAMRAKTKSECFSLAHFVEDEALLSNCSLLHVSAHGHAGKDADGKEKSEIKFSRDVFFLYAEALNVAVLNVCSLGACINGVVGDLLGKDSSIVIATPYEIPDTSWIDFNLLYRHFREEALFEPVLFFMLLDKRFRLFYRVFSPYYTY